jgi:hypothetical protein
LSPLSGQENAWVLGQHKSLDIDFYRKLSVVSGPRFEPTLYNRAAKALRNLNQLKNRAIRFELVLSERSRGHGCIVLPAGRVRSDHVSRCQLRDGSRFMLRRQMSVTKGHFVVCVAEQFPGGGQIDSQHDQSGREAVPNVVPTKCCYGGIREYPYPGLADIVELPSVRTGEN